MDHSLLRSWLGLNPGPWPPDHYTLLGLRLGECDPTVVESLVLDRMERLRSHQLLHPELVTEGMNRLAQALVCLTDPVARAAYDAELGLPIRAVRPAEESPSDADATVRDQELLLDQPPGSAPYEVVEEPSPEPLPLPGAYEVIWDADSPTRPAYEVVEVGDAELVSRLMQPWHPATRRDLFARLAAVRRAVAAWRSIEPFLGDPREPLARPVRVLMMLEALGEVRLALDSVQDLIGVPGEPGSLVVALVAQPLMLHTFRLLLPDQRRAVATDWRRGEAALKRDYARLRELVKTGRPVRSRSRQCRGLIWMLQTPELAIVVLTVIAILAVFLQLRGPG